MAAIGKNVNKKLAGVEFLFQYFRTIRELKTTMKFTLESLTFILIFNEYLGDWNKIKKL